MTYVSRRARIIAPRWPNESDTDFLFRTRRRCDGRLKRHSSSLDLRAWINNSCIKHEYLLELMSDGEVTLTPPFQLFGRFIPVPLLFKLAQKTVNGEGTGEGKLGPVTAANPYGEEGTYEGVYGQKGTDENQAAQGREGIKDGKPKGDKTLSHDPGNSESDEFRFQEAQPSYDDNEAGADKTKSDSQTSLTRVLWEKDVIEKNLFKSTCLLTKALGKLEKIDNIIQVANEEVETMRKEEIQEVFCKPNVVCYCSGRNKKNFCGKVSGWDSKERAGNDGAQRLRDANKCNEVLRQISGLREKLKKNQDCRQKVNLQIGMIRRRSESSSSTHTAETYTQREQPELKKLEKKLERLVNERGKLLSEMCQALTLLNSMKKSNNSRTAFVRRRSKSDDSRNGFPVFPQDSSVCDCNHCQSHGTETNQCCDTPTSDDDHHSSYPCYDCSSADNLDLGQEQEGECDGPGGPSAFNGNAFNNDFCKDRQQEKETRQFTFVCQSCKTRLEADRPSFDGCLSSEQHPGNGGTFGNNPCRPSTSPTTGRERKDAWVVRCCFSPRQRSTPCQNGQGRRVKSETTMKEIEKTLRNYEQRLSDMDGLECRVEEWKRKLLEACQWRKNASKMEAEFRMERDAERDKSSKEMNGLFSENVQLKKKVRELMDKYQEQAQKIHNLKCGVMKTRDLETETEELKKELSEYRNCYEHQRKCINKWESVVALQRKEIENLMNHIRKLTTERMKEKMGGGCSDRRQATRSRSYSPEGLVECQEGERPNKAYDGYEENGSCCCQEFRQSESRRTQLRYFDGNYYSSVSGTEDWCN